MNERTALGYWLVTNLFIIGGLFFWAPALYGAILVTTIHALHCYLYERNLVAFPMQVRLGFIALLMLGYAPWSGWIHWVQLAGTTALLTVGYCPLARLLCLLPWNSPQPFSWGYARRVIFSPPCDGSIVEAVPTHNAE